MHNTTQQSVCAENCVNCTKRHLNTTTGDKWTANVINGEMNELGNKMGWMGDWTQENKERSEEERALLQFIALSPTSCTDRYWSTKGDERLGCVCGWARVCRCLQSKIAVIQDWLSCQIEDFKLMQQHKKTGEWRMWSKVGWFRKLRTVRDATKILL